MTAAEKQALVAKHMPLIRAAAFRLSSNLPACMDKEDLEQIGVIGLLDAAKRFKAEKGCGFKGYAYLRIRGEMIEEIRKAGFIKRSKKVQTGEAVSLDEYIKGPDGNRLGWLKSTEPTALEQVEKKEVTRNLIYAVGELKKRDRDVIVLYYFYDMTMREIGEKTGVSLSRISQIRKDALRQLRGKLEIVC
jgi:RNA polymerase sigma factor for flagellar operon FliA